MPTAARSFQVHVVLRDFAGNKTMRRNESGCWLPPGSPQWPHASAELMLVAWQLPEALPPHLAPVPKQAPRQVTQLVT